MAIKIGGTTVIDDSRAANVVSITGLTTPLTPGQGGTGLAAAGTSGNILVSNGSAWTSAAPAAAGGGGSFNTNITTAGGVEATTSYANVFAAPSTSGLRYVLHSLHLTNISGTTPADFNIQVLGNTYPTITLANMVPLPALTSVEVLKKPKVLQPNDYLQIVANTSSTVHATYTIERVSGTAHFGGGVDISDSATYNTLWTATANSVIESILLSNDDGINDVKARVQWTTGADSVQGWYAYDLIIPADATVEILEMPKFLQNGYKVRVYANQANRLEAVISGKITGT